MAIVVREHIGEADHVEWWPAFVVSGDEIREDFYIPHFLEGPDVLSREASTWGVNGEPIRWVLSRAKTRGKGFFPSHAYGQNIIVSTALRDAFLGAGLVGLDIKPARIAD